MQGGGQFYSRSGAGTDFAERRAQDEVENVQGDRRVRRHRAQHRQSHFGWLHLGHRSQSAKR
jgi:hypothetical protein